MFKRFRAGTLETCSLSTSGLLKEPRFDLIVPVGLSLADGACGPVITLAILS